MISLEWLKPKSSNFVHRGTHFYTAHEAKKTLERCVTAIKDWCASRRLKLNEGKTEVIWLGTRPRLHVFSTSSRDDSPASISTCRSEWHHQAVNRRTWPGRVRRRRADIPQACSICHQQLLLSTTPSPPNSEARQLPSHEAVGACTCYQ